MRHPGSSLLPDVGSFAGGGTPATLEAPTLPILPQGHMRVDLLRRPCSWRQHALPAAAVPHGDAGVPYALLLCRPERRRDRARLPTLRSLRGDEFFSVTGHLLISSTQSELCSRWKLQLINCRR